MRFKKLVLAHHPDRGGDVKVMQEINNAFDQFLIRVPNRERTTVYDEGGGWHSHSSRYFEVLGTLLAREGNFEVKAVGDWIWVFDANEPMLVFNLTLMGFEYSRKHKGMFWIDPPARGKQYRHNKLSFEDIERLYGSETKRKGRYVE